MAYIIKERIDHRQKLADISQAVERIEIALQEEIQSSKDTALAVDKMRSCLSFATIDENWKISLPNPESLLNWNGKPLFPPNPVKTLIITNGYTVSHMKGIVTTNYGNKVKSPPPRRRNP